MSNSAGSFFGGVADGMGLGMQMKNMKQSPPQANNNMPQPTEKPMQQGSAVDSTSLGLGLGALPVAAQKNPQAASDATGMWGSLMKLVGG